MKVKDLLKEIKECKKEFGKDFLEWDIYTEQLSTKDKRCKRRQENWGVITDADNWEYFECAGFWTKMPNEKIFTININF